MTEKITREEIEALLKLADAATPGPWKQHLVDDTTVICPQRDICCTFPEGGLNDDVDFSSDTEQCEADAAFIAAANPAILKALCTLALQAEAMQPRPIEEAPKDGTRILAWWGGEWVITYWAKRPGFEGWQIPSGMVVKAHDKTAWQPTEFTSLPEPRR